MLRTIALVLLLLGVLAYLLSYYRQALPFDIPLGNDDSHNVAAVLVIAGLVTLIWSRR